MLKIQRRFKSERHNVFPKEVNKIGLSSNVDKKMKSCIWNEQRCSM